MLGHFFARNINFNPRMAFFKGGDNLLQMRLLCLNISNMLCKLDRNLSGLVHACTVDGKDMGMPSEVMMVGFYYNKDLFQQAGIEKAPVTYEEFLDLVDKLNAARTA